MRYLLQPALATLVTAMALAPATTAWSQQAQIEPPARTMALRDVMQQLGRDMQAITGAISTEDWAKVTELAPQIAHHEQPPASEKLRILGWLGSDAGKFRGLDGDVEQAAIALGEAAQRGDGEAVIAAFARIQQNCLACHQSYRQSFVEHFYGLGKTGD